jgi:hypothetical protein
MFLPSPNHPSEQPPVVLAIRLPSPWLIRLLGNRLTWLQPVFHALGLADERAFLLKHTKRSG